MNAHDAFENILLMKIPSCEHIGSPPAASKLLDSSTAVVEKPGRSVSVPGPDDSWMDGLSAVDVIRQFGLDPNAVLTPEGKLETSERERIRTCLLRRYRGLIFFRGEHLGYTS